MWLPSNTFSKMHVKHIKKIVQPIRSLFKEYLKVDIDD